MQNKNSSFSLSLPFILHMLNISIPENSSTLINFSFGILILIIVCIICFLNVFGFLIINHLINKYNIENKYPKLKKIIEYYKKISLVYIIIEGLICLSCLMFIFIACILMIKTNLI